jgi:hypothetical protein
LRGSLIRACGGLVENEKKAKKSFLVTIFFFNLKFSLYVAWIFFSLISQQDIVRREMEREKWINLRRNKRLWRMARRETVCAYLIFIPRCFKFIFNAFESLVLCFREGKSYLKNYELNKKNFLRRKKFRWGKKTRTIKVRRALEKFS